MTSQTEPSGRDKLLHAAVGLLDDHGPDALQTRKVANAAGTSTMAVYTHFGGMRGLIAEIAQEGCANSPQRWRCRRRLTRSPTWWRPGLPTAATPWRAPTCTG